MIIKMPRLRSIHVKTGVFMGLSLYVFMCSTQSVAQDETEKKFDDRFYASVMYSRAFADQDRMTKDGNGGLLAVGKGFSEHVSAELYILGEKYRAESGSGSADMKAVAASFSYFPFAGTSFDRLLGSAYLLGGVGYGYGSSNIPTIPSSNQHRYIYEMGAGYLVPIIWDVKLRVDVRYRFDQVVNGYDGTANGSRGGFAEPVASVGFLIPIGSKHVPSTPPAAPAEVVPATPLPPVDSDGDGVFDEKDQCSGTPHGVAVNDVGCPLPLPCKNPGLGERVTLAGCGDGDVIILRGVNFEFDKSRLTPDAKSILDNVSDELKAHPLIAVEMSGHTDSRGGDDYNQRLSEARAQSVVKYLAGTGISQDRLTATGYGESQPIADNETDEGRELNRRVELKILSGGAVADDSIKAPTRAGSEASASTPDAGEGSASTAAQPTADQGLPANSAAGPIAVPEPETPTAIQ